ncbi:MAG: FAD-dependent oxidoreductase [Christensenellales bacterium]|jgi:fumarate reductase flavoprotein subunit
MLKRLLSFVMLLILVLSFSLTGTMEGTTNSEMNVDVVVVGSGGAGLSAAVEASKAGAKTLVIEKLGIMGGNTSICSGNIYAANSETQKEMGLTESGTAEELTEFFVKQGDGDKHVNREFISFISERSGEAVDWLVKDIGVSLAHRSPTSSHRSLISESSGVGIVNALAKRATEQGTEILLNTAATKLIVKDGVVQGVEAVSKGSKLIINAKKVILATGGYDGQDESKAKYAPGSVGHHTYSAVGNVGDAIEMVKAVNGKILLKGGLSGIHLVNAGPLNSPVAPLRMIKNCVAVTDLGYRYANESMTSAFDYYNPMVRTGRKQFFNIVDSTVENELLEMAVAEDAAYKADSIEELAIAAGIPAYTLMTTIDEYNELCKAGTDTVFGKNAEDLLPLVKAPFYAVKITPNTNGSFGGLVTNNDAQVLDVNNKPIENLYAAGAVANADMFYLRYPVSGSSVMMCLVMGRVAGQQATK